MLFDGYEKIDNGRWENAYIASPKVYNNDYGEVFGAFALTEEVDTIFPIDPRKSILLDEKKISDWKMAMVSTSKAEVLFAGDYNRIMDLLKEYIVENKDEHVLIRGLSLSEIEGIITKY